MVTACAAFELLLVTARAGVHAHLRLPARRAALSIATAGLGAGQQGVDDAGRVRPNKSLAFTLRQPGRSLHVAAPYDDGAASASVAGDLLAGTRVEDVLTAIRALTPRVRGRVGGDHVHVGGAPAQRVELDAPDHLPVCRARRNAISVRRE